jgi:hypothetical protein
MPEEPTHTRWGERLRERTQPLQPNDEQYGWAHAILCEALAKSYEQIAELIDPPEPYPPWGPLFDINVCPGWALPFLAQAVGIRLPVGMDDAMARQVILEAAGHNVGKVSAIKAVLQHALVSQNPPAPPTVWFRERDGSAYRLEIVTLAAETPDPAAVETALEASIPGGLAWSFRYIDAWDYQAMTSEGGTYAEQSAMYSTYSDLREHKTSGPDPSLPRLDSVVPNTATRLTPLTLTFTGNFPDDMTGFTADVTVAMELLPAEGFQVVKVSDSECTADGTPPHVGNEQVGTVCILDAAGQPYTNTLPFTITM